MRVPHEDDDDEAVEFDDDDIQLVMPQDVTVPAGYVAVPLDDYNNLVAMAQRMLILADRVVAGEKLSKSMMLRALGMTDEADAEMAAENYEKFSGNTNTNTRNGGKRKQ